MSEKQEIPVSPELAAIREARKTVALRAASAAQAAEARAADPAVLLAQEKLALAREQLAADVAEHELVADQIYLDACLRLGEDRVAIVRTRYGSIVVRAQSAMEMDAQEARANGHRVAAQMAKTPAERELAEKNALTAMELGFAAAVLTDAKHFDRVTTQNPGIWPTLWKARNTLIDASVAAEGKAGAR